MYIRQEKMAEYDVWPAVLYLDPRNVQMFVTVTAVSFMFPATVRRKAL